MKIALQCRSLLLQDSLRYYLSNHLCDISDCDFIVSDQPIQAQKPVYQINVDTNTLPFIPSELLEQLQKFSDTLNPSTASSTRKNEENAGDDELKSEIQSLLMEFTDKFLQIIKKHR